jgi:UDP:flavonoid glycosyltransferase YjiC (YdhE family)
MIGSLPQKPGGNVQNPRSVIALISARGGGDAPPVSTLAGGLAKQGHQVTLLTDGPISGAFFPPGVPTLPHGGPDQATVFDAPRSASRDWVEEWADRCFSSALETVRLLKPDILICSLHCMHLAESLARAMTIPWILVNASFYFGEDALQTWEADFPSPYMIAAWRNRFLPPTRRATRVLHATDPIFDPPPPTLPPHHHYVGPLIWEGDTAADLSFLDEVGPPWILVTLSTLPQPDEILLARAAVAALADKPFRVLLTLPPGQPREQLGHLPDNVKTSGFLPHRPILQRSALLISQAGHGLVIKGLYHGVPMVLIPWDRDQPGVAARAQALGVAASIPRPEVSGSRVAAVIERVLGNPQFAKTAAFHAARLQSQDAVQTACDLVTSLTT